MDASKHRRRLEELVFTVPDHLKADLAKIAEFRASPEGGAFWNAIMLHLKENDEEPLRKFVRERFGNEPRQLVPRVRAHALQVLKGRGIGELTPKEVWDFLAGHEVRLKSRAEADRLPEAAKIRSGMKSFSSVKLALRYWCAGGEKGKDTLYDTIRTVAYIERAELGASSEKLAGRVASRLRREGIERPDKPGRVFTPGPEGVLMHADDQEEAAFALRELLAQKMFEAGVTDQEAESFEASVRLGSNEAASEEVGRSAGQVGVEKHRAIAKLRRVV